MNVKMTAYDIYQELMSLPEGKLAEVWQFVEWLKYGKQAELAVKKQIESQVELDEWTR